MKIDRDVVLHIAKLARLALTEEEVELFSRQLGDILHYIDQLKGVDQPAEPFSYSRFLPAVTRPDERQPSLSPGEALRNAPEAARQFFRVPRILP